ncbi:MAG: hypothetical protein U0414_17680 [Polyangiaceae bacterium]
MNLRTRSLETSIAVLGVPQGAAASALRALEGRFRDERSECIGAVIPLGGADEEVVGFDYVPPPELAFGRAADFRGCDLRVRLRAPSEAAPEDEGKRLAAEADGILVLAGATSSAPQVDALVADLRASHGARPLITLSEGEPVELLDGVERLVERALGSRPSGTAIAQSSEKHPLLDALRALLARVADEHMERVEATLGRRIDARFAELADGKRVAEIDKRLARVAAELTGRAASESRWRADETTRASAVLDRVDAVERLLAQIDPDVSEMARGITELGAALTTIGGTLETLVSAVEVGGARAESRGRRLDAAAAVLASQVEAVHELGARQEELARRMTAMDAELERARADIAEAASSSATLVAGVLSRLDGIEAGLVQLRRERSPETVELVREVAELCDEIKKKKKGWFG